MLPDSFSFFIWCPRDLIAKPEGIWPMFQYNKKVQNIIILKQKYLALLSSIYNLRSTQVESQVLSWVSNLDMRIFAIETVYQSSGNQIPGIDGVILSKENLLNQLEFLTENQLFNYKTSLIRKVFILKKKKKKLSF